MPDSNKKLFLLDAYALIFRSYYSFIRNPRINSKGMNTSAAFGFVNTLLDIINNQKPSHIAVVFDSPEATFRHEEFPEYKANRDATPEDIRLAVPYIIDIIKGFNIPTVAVPGYEADDIIGTMAKTAEKKGFITYMMTPDKDFGQLVSENIFMFKPARSGNSAEVLGIKEICEKFEISNPLQVIDILGLWGDAVDNIPGIPGIGEKTSKKLIAKYESLEGLIAHADELQGKQKENVINFAEQGLLSKKLATIKLDVPLEFNEETLRLKDPNIATLNEIFADLEFRALAKKIAGKDKQILPPKGTQLDMFGGETLPDGSTEEFNNEAAETPLQVTTIKNTPHTYELIKTNQQIKDLVQKLKMQKEVCFDTETTSIDQGTAELVGISFSFKKGTGYYIPMPKERDVVLERLNYLRSFFEDENIVKVGQNIKYDLRIIRNYGIQVKGKLFDTMIAHYLLHPELRHNMDDMAITYLHYTPVSITELIGKKGKNQLNMREIDIEQVCEYAVEDADVTFQLMEVFKPKMINKLQNLFYDIEMPLVRVLCDMEYEGINLDTKALGLFSKELHEDLTKLEKNITKLAGTEFNIDSPKQLGQVLFEVLAVAEKPKKTKTGQYATGEDILKQLENSHPIIESILDYRSLKKLKSTYVDALPLLINPNTHRIHTSFMQAITTTGRLSSNNPNLQNIPIRTEKGREIRKAFIPRNKDYLLMAADYSQIELRIVAALSEDKTMIEAFNNNLDIHTATAARIFRVELSEVTREMRSKAKSVNFGIIYGQSAFGLAQNINISRNEAKEIIDNYFEQYPMVKQLMNKNIEKARKQGYVSTLLGRRRYLSDINSRNATVRSHAERNAINTPIQGTAADVIKVAMIAIHEELIKKNYQSKLLLQVHDELVFDVNCHELEEIKSLVKIKMENAISLSVPLLVEIDCGNNWLEAH